MPAKAHVPSVFVRGLPFSVSDERLAAHFSDVAPVKRAFIVRDKTTKESRGFGFVQFALEEDAAEAAQKLNESMLDSRLISVEVSMQQDHTKPAPVAATKQPLAVANVSKPEAPAAPAAPAPAAKRPRPEQPAGRPESRPDGEGAFRKKPKMELLKPLMPPTQKEFTVVLFGLDGSVDKKKLWVRLRKTHGAKRCDFPIDFPGSSTGCKVALVVYDTSANASSAQRKLDGHYILGHDVAARRASDVRQGVDAHTHARLIMRNLPFDAAAEHVYNAIARHVEAKVRASVVDVHLPLKPGQEALVAEYEAGRAAREAAAAAAKASKGSTGADDEGSDDSDDEDGDDSGSGGESASKANGSAPAAEVAVKTNGKGKGKGAAPMEKIRRPLNRGFGFIQCATKADAATILAALNGKRVHKREVVVDWAAPKGTAVPEATQEAGKGKEEDKETDSKDEEEEEQDASSSDGSDSGSEASAEDAAKDNADVDAAVDKAGDADASDGSSGSDDDEDMDEDDASDADQDDEDGDDGEDGEGEHGDSGSVASASTSASVTSTSSTVDNNDAARGCTLFLRNVSFDTLDSELVETFKPFGPVKYARVVVDQDTGRSRGVAFVQFYTKDGADRALAASGAKDDKSEDFEAPRPGENEAQIKRRKTYAEAVEAALLDGGIRDKPGGRPLMVARARTHEESKRAATLKAAEGGVGPSGKKYDARHTYLAHEGTIRADSEAGQHMPPSDRTKREEATRTKKQKLTSPLFFVSPTRLSVRNLAKHVDDAGLKSLARQAALDGMRDKLVTASEGDPRLMPAPGDKPPALKVVTAKILREAVEGTADIARQGKGKFKGGHKGKPEPVAANNKLTGISKGFGFVEFGCHMHALAALRKLNNNPEYSKAFSAGGSAAVKAGKKEDEWPRLIVEFAVENTAKVKKHEERKAAAAVKRQALIEAGVIKPSAAVQAGAGAAGAGPKGKDKPAKDKGGKGKDKAQAAPAAPSTDGDVDMDDGSSAGASAAAGAGAGAGQAGGSTKADRRGTKKERREQRKRDRAARAAEAAANPSSVASAGSVAAAKAHAMEDDDEASGSAPKRVRFTSEALQGGDKARPQPISMQTKLARMQAARASARADDEEGLAGASAPAPAPSTLRQAVLGKGPKGQGKPAQQPKHVQPREDEELEDLVADVKPRAKPVSGAQGGNGGPGRASADVDAAGVRRAGKKSERQQEDRTDALIGDYMRKLYGAGDSSAGKAAAGKGSGGGQAASAKPVQGGKTGQAAGARKGPGADGGAPAPVIADKWL